MKDKTDRQNLVTSYLKRSTKLTKLLMEYQTVQENEKKDTNQQYQEFK